MVVERLALDREDGGVGRQQVLTLHARAAGPGADQEREFGAVERLLRLVGGDDVVEQRKGAVPELHDHPVESAEGGRDLEQVQTDGPIGSE